jgi:bifunctional isochorismate lyase/aryl carrier protein
MSIPKIASYPMPAEVPAGRVDWPFEPDRAALLVHDLQDYFVGFYDSAVAPVPALLANTRRLVDAARAAGMPVFYTAQPARQDAADRGLLNAMWGPGLTAHPDRAAICAAVAPAPGDVVLTKWRYSAFQRSDLEAQLAARDRDQLVICGVYAHIGCLMTACDAFMRDIEPFLVADAVADFSLREHRMALDYVAHRCGRVVLTEALLAQAAAPRLPSTPEALAAWVAGSLQVDRATLAGDANLLDLGLDSIRLMAFAEAWREAGRDVSFVQLAERPTLAAWWHLLQAAPAAAAGAMAWAFESHAAVTLPQAERVLFKLCKHFAIKVPVVFDAEQADIDFGYGRCRVQRDGDRLALHCSADAEALLHRVQYVLDEHLALMARDRALTMAWQRATEAPR